MCQGKKALLPHQVSQTGFPAWLPYPARLRARRASPRALAGTTGGPGPPRAARAEAPRGRGPFPAPQDRTPRRSGGLLPGRAPGPAGAKGARGPAGGGGGGDTDSPLRSAPPRRPPLHRAPSAPPGGGGRGGYLKRIPGGRPAPAAAAGGLRAPVPGCDARRGRGRCQATG